MKKVMKRSTTNEQQPVSSRKETNTQRNHLPKSVAQGETVFAVSTNTFFDKQRIENIFPSEQRNDVFLLILSSVPNAMMSNLTALSNRLNCSICYNHLHSFTERSTNHSDERIASHESNIDEIGIFS